jgi:hypothetical protein
MPNQVFASIFCRIVCPFLEAKKKGSKALPRVPGFCVKAIFEAALQLQQASPLSAFPNIALPSLFK